MKRGSMELGVNMIVVMIICTVLLGIGIWLVTSGIAAANKYTDDLRYRNEQMVWSQIKSSGALVALYPSTQTLSLGGTGYVTIGIDNQLGSQTNFYAAVDPGSGSVPGIVETFISGPYIVNNNVQSSFFISFKIGRDQALKGSHVFKIYVCKEQCDASAFNNGRYDNQYGDTQLAQINVR